MKDLEEEEQELQGKIAVERAAIPTVTRDQIIYYMESFRSGDVSDPAFQKSLFDGFLEAAYLYDDRLKIVFNYTKGENEIDIPIVLDETEASTGESSFTSLLLHCIKVRVVTILRGLLFYGCHLLHHPFYHVSDKIRIKR